MRSLVSLAHETLGPRATILGVGGISLGADAKKAIGAGVDFVKVYTAFICAGPFAAKTLTDSLDILFSCAPRTPTSTYPPPARYI